MVILLQAIRKWKEEHNGEAPKSMKEKNEFKEMIKSAKRSSKETNFEEAEKSYYKPYTAPNLTTELVLENAKADPAINENLGNFWNMVATLKLF